MSFIYYNPRPELLAKKRKEFSALIIEKVQHQNHCGQNDIHVFIESVKKNAISFLNDLFDLDLINNGQTLALFIKMMIVEIDFDKSSINIQIPNLTIQTTNQVIYDD